MWKGVIKFGDIEVPVKLYAAVQERTVHFRLLHETDEEPVKQRMINPDSGRAVAPEKVRKGYQVEPGTWYLLDSALPLMVNPSGAG